MILTSDRDYKDTKKIKQGKKKLREPFNSLALWINKKYRVPVLNIYYDTIYNGQPRINIIMEHPSHLKNFRKGPYGNFNAKRQKEIAEKFSELAGNIESKHMLISEDVFVCFSDFSSIALAETNEKIDQKEIESLKQKYSKKNIWEIARFGRATTFFFYTDKQAEDATGNGIYERLRTDYFNILKEYDEFGYLDFDKYSIYLDSKENFDNNYESNWYYYYK